MARQEGPHLPSPLPSVGCLPPGVILVGSVATKTRDPWMPEKATGERESWLQKAGSVVHGFHASLFCLGQVSSDHRAFALVAPSGPGHPSPDADMVSSPSPGSGASLVTSLGGPYPDLLTPIAHPCTLPCPSDDPCPHLRPRCACVPWLVFRSPCGLSPGLSWEEWLFITPLPGRPGPPPVSVPG